MKSFLLSVKKVNANNANAYTSLIPSANINITNNYMLFDDGFIRREEASEDEPSCITVYDNCGESLGVFTLAGAPQKDKPCVWTIDNDPNKELVIRRLKAITEPSTAKDYYKWLLSQNNMPSDKLNYLLGEVVKEGYGAIKNMSKASQFFLAGMNNDNSSCKVAYAQLLLTGWFGQQPDPKKAITYLNSAISEGNLLAKSQLADVYIKNNSLPDAANKVLQIGQELMNSTEEFMLDSVVRTMAEYYNNPMNRGYDKGKAIELYSRFDPNVTLKEFAFLLIDNDMAGKDKSRATLEEKAFAFVSNASNPVFNDKFDTDELRKALLCRCHRIGIGTPKNIQKSLNKFGQISISQSAISPSLNPKNRKAIVRNRYENLLAAVDNAIFEITNAPSTKGSYRRYGSILEYLGYLKEFSNEGMPDLSGEIRRLSGFIDSLGQEYVNGYNAILKENQEIAERAEQARIRLEQEEQKRKLKEAEEMEKERQRKLKEAEEERKRIAQEADERLRSGKDVKLEFTCRTISRLDDDDDFDDSPTVYKDEFTDRISREEYFALLSGGEKAIKAYAQAHMSERDWGGIRTIVLSATMTKIS